MRSLAILAIALLSSSSLARQQSPPITTAGQPAELVIGPAGGGVRITLTPVSFKGDLHSMPYFGGYGFGTPLITLRTLAGRIDRTVGNLRVSVEPSPLRVTVTDKAGRVIQTLRFEQDGTLSFDIGDGPVLGMGEGGPRPARGTPWREQAVQFDRRGALDTMEPRWQSDMYGSRNPAAV